MNPPIPVPDVLPLPAPAGLIQFLLVLTFILHLVPMNFLLGGSILAGFSHLFSKRNENHARLARRLSELIPATVAMTVTLGVAPLLFVQVLYGHLLYSSSILMANAWFLVVPLVIIGYYGVYLLRFKWDRLGAFRPYVAWGLAALFVGVGFIYSNNFSLMQRPDTWKSHYFASPATGHLDLSDAALYPRYLHMLLGAVAVAGVWVLLIGARRRSGDDRWSNWAMRYGGRVFTQTTLLNIVVGFWFMISVPRRAMMIFMGKNMLATVAFMAALVFIMGALHLLGRASRRKQPRLAFIGAGMLLVVLALMAIMRQEMRAAYLEPYFRLDQLQAQPQWGVFVVFVVTLLLGLAAVGWLVRVVLTAKKA